MQKNRKVKDEFKKEAVKKPAKKKKTKAPPYPPSVFKRGGGCWGTGPGGMGW